MRVRQQSHDFTDPPVAELIVAAAVETDMTFSWDIGDGWTSPARVRGGSFHILPPMTEARIRAHGEQDMIFLSLPVRGDLSALQAANIDPALIIRGRTDYRHDAQALGILKRMWREAALTGLASSLKVDSLILTLIARMVGPDLPPPSGHPLARPALGRVTEMIEDDLEMPLRLADLAAATGLTTIQFLRAFKSSVGLTPHQYVIDRRIARARALLSESRLTIAEVAYACGFSSQAHMTQLFRSRLGATPGMIRRAAG